MSADNDKYAIDSLFKRSLKYKDSKDFVKFFDFIRKFNHYSRYNTMLVYIQNPGVTFFGGVSYWRNNFNRKVTKNAKPHVILAPQGPIMLVYDVFDTDGKDSPQEFLDKGLGSKPFEVLGAVDDNVIYHAIQECNKFGIEIHYRKFSYFKGGHVTTAIHPKIQIHLNETLGIKENLATLIHELAHIFLGHTRHKFLYPGDKSKPIKLIQRGDLTIPTAELEAETVCYLICNKLGLNTRAAEYLAGYIKNEFDLLNFNYELAITVSDKIDRLFIRTDLIDVNEALDIASAISGVSKNQLKGLNALPEDIYFSDKPSLKNCWFIFFPKTFRADILQPDSVTLLAVSKVKGEILYFGPCRRY